MLFTKTFSAIALILALSAAPVASQDFTCHNNGRWGKQADAKALSADYCRIINRPEFSCYNNGTNRWNFQACKWLEEELCISQFDKVIDGCSGKNEDTQGGWGDIGGCVFKVDPNSGKC
ncbi:hypothetical protein BD779DRAFT_1571134, partial [Infundibulicybe gibba]